ncbi:MAG: hypothetical protein ACREUX_01035 [Burkholderiales bacterium]
MSRLMQSPVAAGSDWEALLASLQARPGAAALTTAPLSLLRAVLVAPVAVARWIAERAPQLAAKSALHILVVGAEKLDAVDQGRWYQLLPALLGADLDVRVTLVGDRLDAGARSPVRALAPSPAARLHAGSLASYLAVHSAGEHDLVFLFHPGFQKHRGWLHDASLAALVAAGAPLVASAYGQDESEVDRWVAQCHGYSTHAETLLNPFCLDFSDADSALHWGRALWQFADRIPDPGAQVDHGRLARLDQLSRMVMHSIALGNTPLAPQGAMVAISASNGASRKLIYLFDEYFLDPGCSDVLALRAGELQSVVTLPAAAIADYPGSDASDLERAVWAAAIKTEHLMAHYDLPVDDETGHVLARAMHADLTQKVDALLEGCQPKFQRSG